MNVASLAASFTGLFGKKNADAPALPRGVVKGGQVARGIQDKITNLLELTQQLQIDGVWLRDMRADLGLSFARFVATFSLSKDQASHVIADALGLSPNDAAAVLDAAGWNSRSLGDDDFVETAKEMQATLARHADRLERQLVAKASKEARTVQQDLWDMLDACQLTDSDFEIDQDGNYVLDKDGKRIIKKEYFKGPGRYASVLNAYQIRLSRSLAGFAERVCASTPERAQLMKNVMVLEKQEPTETVMENEDFFTIAQEIGESLRNKRDTFTKDDPTRYSRSAGDVLMDKFEIKEVAVRAVKSLSQAIKSVRDAASKRANGQVTLLEERLLVESKSSIELLLGHAITYVAACPKTYADSLAMYQEETREITMNTASSMRLLGQHEDALRLERSAPAKFKGSADARPGLAPNGAESMAKLFAPLADVVTLPDFAKAIAQQAEELQVANKEVGRSDYRQLHNISQEALTALEELSAPGMAGNDASSERTFQQVWSQSGVTKDLQAA